MCYTNRSNANNWVYRFKGVRWDVAVGGFCPTATRPRPCPGLTGVRRSVGQGALGWGFDGRGGHGTPTPVDQ